MSKYIDEIVELIYTNPDGWIKSKDGDGIYGYYPVDDPVGKIIKITDIGNSIPLSISKVFINETPIIMTWRDSNKIERAVLRWFKTVSLKTLMT